MIVSATAPSSTAPLKPSLSIEQIDVELLLTRREAEVLRAKGESVKARKVWNDIIDPLLDQRVRLMRVRDRTPVSRPASKG